MTRNVALALVAGGLVGLSAAVALAQDLAVLDDLYGRGVHAYFSRDSRKAHDLLTQAIDNGSEDPRAYYFRGLALRNLGRDDDAALDFKKGAEIEASGEDLIGKVSRSLERVQGPVRLELESTRKMARLRTRNERKARAERRYGDLQEGDEEVIRRPAASGTRRPPARLPEPAIADDTDPFAEGAAPLPKPTTEPAPEPTEEPAPATPKPATDDPFAEPAPKPATPKPAADDPFGEDPAPAPAPKPAAPKPATDDPFAEPTEPAPEKPATPPAKPAGDEDPFGTPAEKPATPPAPAPGNAASKPGRAASSLFSALKKAFTDTGDEAKKDENVKPAINLEDAKDPFADDSEPAPAKPAPAKKPAEKQSDDPFAEDPFAK